jgi:dynein assembly factor with WDR repeat domains 1
MGGGGKLKKFLLRFYPPGIIMDYEDAHGVPQQKALDLLELDITVNVEQVVTDLIASEPLLSEKRRPMLRELVQRLIEKIGFDPYKRYSLFKVLRAHLLPLTNCGFNKTGDRFITGSYDRTCKIWDTQTGEEMHVLEGHKNVVYAIAFNNPFGDKVVTGSFDKTCKLWDANTGELFYTLKGHETEIVCVSMNPQSTIIATGSMDNTAKLWDVERGVEVRKGTKRPGWG